MPPDISEKEKILGGVFTLVQGAWLTLGFALFLIFGFLLSFLFGYFSFVLSIPFLVLGVIFAIKKKHELTYFTYLKLNHIYNKKIKELPNRQIKITDDGEDE